MFKFRVVWILWGLFAVFLWLLISAVYLRVFAPNEAIGLLPTSVLIDSAAKALNVGSRHTGCGRAQYEDVPTILSLHEYRFRPKLDFEKNAQPSLFPLIHIGEI
jgi:hypothetical protein